MTQLRGARASILALASLILACVPVLKAPQREGVATEHFTAPPGKARIYCYRASAGINGGIVSTVFVDGKVVGKIAHGQYIFVDVEPGHHVVSVDWFDPDANSWQGEGPFRGVDLYGGASVKVELAGDRVYFVRDRLGNDLALVTDATGREDLANCRHGWRPFPKQSRD